MSLFYISFTAFLVALFGLRDCLVLFFSRWPHLYPVVNIDTLTFEEVHCYLPFATHFSLNNLLPAAPMAQTSGSAITVFPPLTLLIQGIIFKYFCLSDIDFYFLFMHTALPVIAFWLLFLIYRKYISVTLATLLAFCGVTFFNNFSSLQYVFNSLAHPDQIVSSASLLPMEITRTPSPSLTFVIFMACFWVSVKTFRISFYRSFFITSLWALNIYVYLYNFIAGALFWAIFLIGAHVLREKKLVDQKLFLYLLANGALMAILVVPYIAWELGGSGGGGADIVSNLGIDTRDLGPVFNDWGPLLSYVFPLLIVIAIIKLYCGDYYELFYRFTPVFVMILVEMVVLNLHMIFNGFVQTRLFPLRIGNFFCRYLYYLPAIYFFVNAVKLLHHNSTMNHWAKTVHRFFEYFLVDRRHAFVFTIITLLTFVVVMSAYKSWLVHETLTATRMIEVEHRLELLKTTAVTGEAIVSQDLAVNLLVPVKSDETTLFVNIFSNILPRQEIIQRLLLYARIYKWSPDKMLTFMMPAPWLGKMYEKNDFILSDQELQNGFGYWLAWHRNKVSDAQLARYKQDLLWQYAHFNIEEGIQKFNVRAVETWGDVDTQIKSWHAVVRDGIKIYASGNAYSIK